MTDILEQQAQEEKSLAELTGHALDPGAYMLSREPLLEARGWNWQIYAERTLAIHAPLIAKIIKLGQRTPVAPHMAEIESRLRRMLSLYGDDSPAPAHRLAEPLAHLEREIEEAEQFFHG